MHKHSKINLKTLTILIYKLKHTQKVKVCGLVETIMDTSLDCQKLANSMCYASRPKNFPLKICKNNMETMYFHNFINLAKYNCFTDHFFVGKSSKPF